jgi:uncharacterized protein YacL
MFVWLETTPIAQLVALSLWAYPALLSLHIIGLAIVVGIFSMRDLRLLGIAHGVEPTAFISLGKLAWIGFMINALSGTLLFTSQATIFITSIPFLAKISFISVSMLLAIIIQARLSNLLVEDRYTNSVDRATRFLAAASVSLWISAIIAGRLIAYF